MTEVVNEAMAGACHDFPVRVYYQDTDAGGVVYHANYLNFAERGRTEFLRECGFEMAQLFEDRGLIFTVHRIEVDYLAPARLDDALVVQSRITDLSGASFTVTQTVMREGAVLARLVVRLVLVGEGLRPVRIPDDIRTALGG